MGWSKSSSLVSFELFFLSVSICKKISTKCYFLFFLIRSENYLMKQKKREPRVRWELLSHAHETTCSLTSGLHMAHKRFFREMITLGIYSESQWNIRLVSNMYGVLLLARDNDLIHLTHGRFFHEMVTLGINSESQWNIRLVSNMYGVPMLVRDNDLIHLTHERFLREMVTSRD